MTLFVISLTTVCLVKLTLANQWPYDRYHLNHEKPGWFYSGKTVSASEEPSNHFIRWLHAVSNTQDSGNIKRMFINNTIPRHINDFDELFDYLEVPEITPEKNLSYHASPMDDIPNPAHQARQLFHNLKYDLDPKCVDHKSKWWYRSYDGSCNWLQKNEYTQGQVGTARSRDYNQYSYTNGFSTPRQGPNPRALSNAFFKRNQSIYYEHTPLLLGLIEFIMHDVTYSRDSKDPADRIVVEMPPDEDTFPLNTTFEVWRTEAVSGTGVEGKPRENVNMATTWLDISSLYGSNQEVANSLRSNQTGKLLTQELKPAGQSKYASYLPFNSMGVPMNTKPGVDSATLFAGGDPRTNEDWLMLGVHTLLLREHNRLCDILAKQHPEYDDEQLYQTVKLIMAAKYALIANSYQMAYWDATMPWPRDDGFPLYRQMYGKDFLQINPMNTYPWPLVTKNGKPMVVSAEMAVVYRFHEFIISSFPIKDSLNQTIRDQDVFATGFNATGFIETGLDNILRGTVNTHIPNFKSGVDEKFRSAGLYRGRPFDVVTWSIVHEREQGLPTFNTYFGEYNKQDPKVVVHIRNSFEEFSNNATVVELLKKLYKSPDDVDLVVGVQLDEEFFPGTTVPRSALIISLFSLFGMGNSDRFSIGYAMTRCFLVDNPLNCHPTNALEEIIWAPKPLRGFPNARWLDSFWLTELDLQSHGTNLLWRLITENTEIKQVQKNPLFPADNVKNPVLVEQNKSTWWENLQSIFVSAFEGALAFYRLHTKKINTITALAIVIIMRFLYRRTHRKHTNTPPVFTGLPFVGVARSFQRDPKRLLLRGFSRYETTSSSSFGLNLASLTHFVLSKDEDLKMMVNDNAEKNFSLHQFLAVINFPLITHKDDFESDLHTRLIREHLTKPETVRDLGLVAMKASERFTQKNLSQAKAEEHIDKFVPFLMKYITTVVAACIVGEEAADNSELLDIFATFNDKAIQTMGLSSLLPNVMQWLAGISINRQYKAARKILLPIIQKRRSSLKGGSRRKDVSFMDFILESVDNDQKAADLVVIVVWGGLTNLQATLISLVMDIINAPANVRASLTSGLSFHDTASIDVFTQRKRPDPHNPWTPLRAAMFESIRLSGPITGPARLVLQDVTLPSTSLSPRPQVLPEGQVATLSAYYTHRSRANYGARADAWDHTRFLRSDPAIGSPAYITWGLHGPHMCPGRWFAQQCLLIMTGMLLGRYDITPDGQFNDDEKYIYSAGSVTRRDVGVTVRKRYT